MPSTPAPERHSGSAAAALFPVAELHHYPGNARLHDLERTRESLRQFGQVESLVVNTGTYTGRPHEVLGGNGRLDVMAEDGWTHAGVWWVDLDEQQCRALNLRLNPRHGKDPGYDPAALLEQLQSLDDPELAGYELGDLDDLTAVLADDAPPTPAPGAGGQLEPPPDELPVEQWAVLVVCRDERHQREVYEALDSQGYTTRVVST